MTEAHTAVPQFRTAESLRALRRGLQRASGDFAVFFALFDRIEVRDDLVRRLEESMPGAEIAMVQVDATTEDPLAEVMDQVDEDAGGPVMIFGLERAVRLGSDDAPVLRVLNLERAEWQRRLRRPIVFWIPKALLAAVGRTAPDFLDWRSGTLDFTPDPHVSERDSISVKGVVFQGGVVRQRGIRIPEGYQEARIEELTCRLRTLVPGDDPEIERRRAFWLHELGDHMANIGRFDGALEKHVGSFEIRRSLHTPDIAHDIASLGRERDVLGEARFEELVRQYARSPEVATDILGSTADRSSSDPIPTHEVAEPAAVYEVGGRSEEDEQD